MTGHGGSINCIKVLPNNTDLVLTASEDQSIRLWNIKTGQPITIFGGEKGHQDQVLHIVSRSLLLSISLFISFFFTLFVLHLFYLLLFPLSLLFNFTFVFVFTFLFCFLCLGCKLHRYQVHLIRNGLQNIHLVSSDREDPESNH
jgi:hypothetical protein